MKSKQTLAISREKFTLLKIVKIIEISQFMKEVQLIKSVICALCFDNGEIRLCDISHTL